MFYNTIILAFLLVGVSQVFFIRKAFVKLVKIKVVI